MPLQPLKSLCYGIAGHREAGRVLGMLMGGDEKDPASAVAAKKKPNVRFLPLHHADPTLMLKLKLEVLL